jgi:dynein heavy chain
VLKSDKLPAENTFEREDIKIQDIESFNLLQFVEDIDDITVKAEKKFTLQQNIKKMKDELKQFQLELQDYKGISFLVKGWDDINSTLDDQTVAIQAMLGSSFMKGKLKNETKKYEAKLLELADLMDEVLKTQRNWMYLEPIFSSGDIATTMPLEYKMFVEVDNHWKTTMKGIEEDPGICELQEGKEGVLVAFKNCNNKLDKILKKLNDFLETKRLAFARFFFLANDDLLQILSQTKDPRTVQSHMDKCFEGIAKVQFNDDNNVLGMISAEKEEVAFLKKIDVNEGERKGNVEVWMKDIEKEMIKCLKSMAKESLADYAVTERTAWSKKWPGQIVLAISQIYWT